MSTRPSDKNHVFTKNLIDPRFFSTPNNIQEYQQQLLQEFGEKLQEEIKVWLIDSAKANNIDSSKYISLFIKYSELIEGDELSSSARPS